jgi:endonuclease/exonuclease/phosphatase (EEP) superfamily protein YafD
VIVTELTPEHAAALKPLADALPHGFTVPRGVFGIGVWSRHPLTRRVMHELRGDWLCPVADIEFDVRGRPLRVIGAHLFPPLGGRGDERNLDQMQGLAEYLGPDTGARVVLAGDLNTTPFAARWRALLAATGFRSAAEGHWPWPTWRPRAFARAVFAIPIDHVLLRGDELTAVDYAIGPDVGSDHRPIRVDFVTARKPQ